MPRTYKSSLTLEDRIEKAQNVRYQLSRHLKYLKDFTITDNAKEELQRCLALLRQIKRVLNNMQVSYVDPLQFSRENINKETE